MRVSGRMWWWGTNLPSIYNTAEQTFEMSNLTWRDNWTYVCDILTLQKMHSCRWPTYIIRHNFDNTTWPIRSVTRSCCLFSWYSLERLQWHAIMIVMQSVSCRHWHNITKYSAGYSDSQPNLWMVSSWWNRFGSVPFAYRELAWIFHEPHTVLSGYSDTQSW